MPYTITRRYADTGSLIQHFTVESLDEWISFDGNEWRAAGFDQPDGNYQFFHPALILDRSLERPWGGRRQEVATILWLHTGRVSRGHFIECMYKPGEVVPARAELIEAGHWPTHWPAPSVRPDGCVIGPLADETVIEIKPCSSLLEDNDHQEGL